MKIAFATDDETSISQHFGRASYYLVITVEDRKVVYRERRDKPGHAQFAHEPHIHDHNAHGGQHGFDPASKSRHARMAEVISDCQALLCGGMGAGAYDSLRAYGIQPNVTDLTTVEEALTAYLEGRIVDRIDRLH
jgi:predicted Fe-Mo cluster-binding NifX family protein